MYHKLCFFMQKKKYIYYSIQLMCNRILEQKYQALITKGLTFPQLPYY